MRDKIAIFLVSASLIGFQLAIVNLLSYSQWHHFAYLAVSIAMLGFGSSGVLLSLKSTFFKRLAANQMPLLLILCGMLILFAPALINISWVRFDTFLLFTDYKHIIKLFVTCTILFLPFLVGACAIGLYFMVRSNSIPMLYAWNLAGSAAGGVVLVLLSQCLFPMHLAAFFGIVAVLAGLVISKNTFHVFTAILCLTCGMFIVSDQGMMPVPSEYKSISKSILLPQTHVVDASTSPQGVIEFVESNSLRNVQGMSLGYYGSIPTVDLAFLNGDGYFAFQKDVSDSSFFSKNMFALPYSLLDINSSLFLNPGNTYYPSQAIFFGADAITVVEPLIAICDILRLYDWKKPNISIENTYPREYLNITQKKWDLIQFPVVGTFGGSAGLSAMQEQYLFTTDALKLAMGKLTCEGILSISSYMDSPPRSNLKIIDLAVKSLIDIGMDSRTSILAIRNWNIIQILVKPSGFSEQDFGFASDFCSGFGFDMVSPKDEFEVNILNDSTFYNLSNELIGVKSTGIVENYPFNIMAPTDNSPFFSQFLKISMFGEYSRWLGAGMPFLELGYLIVWVCLAVCILLSVLAIAVPVLFAFRKGNADVPLWHYFAFIGLGYMLIEISLIQKSILIVGNPITASALIISTVLCFSAIGSYISARFSFASSIFYVISGIVLLTLLLAFLSQPIFSYITGYSIWYRVSLLVLLVSPLSFLMGMSFPLAMKQVSAKKPHQIPVVWGVNGFFSVIAAPIGAIIAVEWGFNQVFVLSAFFYFLCLPIAVAINKKNQKS